MNTRVFLMASGIAMVWAGAASAQEYNGATGTAPTTTVVLGSSTTATTGDSTVPPFQNTTTTVQNQTRNSTTPPTTTAVSTTVDGVTYTGTKTVSGTGSQQQTVTSTLVCQFNGGTPPVQVGPCVSNVGAPVNVGSPTVTAVSASGAVGTQSSYASTLTSSGPVSSAGSVTATENSVTSNTAGTRYETRVGTATYNPSTGLVTVALPTAPTNSTAITSSGITITGPSVNPGPPAVTSLTANGLTTTGAVTAGTVTAGTVNAGVIKANVGGAAGAAAIDAGNGRIVNLAAGTAPGDAVNFGQFSTEVRSIREELADDRDRADAGTAVAVALSGAAFLPNKTWNLTANIGGYSGEEAVAGQVAFLASENVAINAGLATSLSGEGGTGWRGGVTFGF